MAQPVHEAQRGISVPLVQQASWEARVTPDPKVRLVPRVTTARLVLRVTTERLVRLVRLATPDTPDTPETLVTGVQQVLRVTPVRPVRGVKPVRQVRKVTPALLVIPAKSVSQCLLSACYKSSY